MRVAFVVYDGMTTLDFIGVYDPVTRLRTMKLMPDLSWAVCSRTPAVTDTTGLRFSPVHVVGSLADYDMLVVPGGPATRELVHDRSFISWLQTGRDCRVKASACTGSLLLGAAGFLKGKRATSHPQAYRELTRYCSTVVEERIADEGDVVTAGGVTASIDLGLHLCEKVAGSNAMETIREQMDYHGPPGV